MIIYVEQIPEVDAVPLVELIPGEVKNADVVVLL